MQFLCTSQINKIKKTNLNSPPLLVHPIDSNQYSNQNTDHVVTCLVTFYVYVVRDVFLEHGRLDGPVLDGFNVARYFMIIRD